MTPTGTVYLVGRKRHWLNPSPPRAYFGATACSGWPVYAGGATPAVSVNIADRCRARGCRERWDKWLQATLHAALAEAADTARNTAQADTAAEVAA